MKLLESQVSFITKLWDHAHHQVQSVTKKENVFFLYARQYIIQCEEAVCVGHV